MPLYEFACRACGHQFETLVRKGDNPSCPACHGVELERVLSQFAVNSETTRESALADGRKSASKVRRDQRHAEAEAIKHHSH
jgi:putative FmdB family regulatory protein